MAITRSAKKEIRASARKRVFNLRRFRVMRQGIKTTKETARTGDVDKAREEYRLAQKAIDKAVKRGIIKKNTGARKKSRLVKEMKAIQST